MKIKSNIKKYSIKFEKDLSFIKDLLSIKNAIFVIDENVYRIYMSYFSLINPEYLYLLDANEENKEISVALEICERITKFPAKRNTTLVSIGGGITQDLTGFVSNITYRGINWIYIPTTLLSACDSCIGGKTSLNYKKYKNLLGTFYPPNEIYICPDFFQTLTIKDFKSGLGEVVKFNLMQGLSGLNNITADIDKLIEKDKDIIIKYVKSSLSYKKKFIEKDEYDHNERVKLNFAHTFGHAIEVISNYIIPHGTAVAIGMIMANRVSERRKYISTDIMKRCENILLRIIDIDINLLECPINEYYAAIKKDKKQIDNNMTVVLITKYCIKGKLSIIHDFSQDELVYAISSFIDLYKENK